MTDRQIMDKLEDPETYRKGSSLRELAECRRINKDLLEACKAALKEMQSFRAYWTGPTMNLAKSKALAEELCEAAIQKAEGAL